MITREEAKAYLDRIVTAKKLLDAPLNPDKAFWSSDNAYYLRNDEKYLLVVGTQRLAEAIGHPFILSHYNEHFDKLSFRYDGIEIYDLVNHGHPRIGKKPA